MQNKSNPIIIILLIAILAVVGYMAFGKKDKVVMPAPKLPTETSDNTPTPPPSGDPTLMFLKKLVAENPDVDIKECHYGGGRQFAVYPDARMADAPTTFYDANGGVIEVCGGYKEEPDPETSLCRTALPNCTQIYYPSGVTPWQMEGVDVYHLAS